jgi:nucleoid-associated protein Lsr2
MRTRETDGGGADHRGEGNDVHGAGVQAGRGVGCEGRWREDHVRGWHGHFSDRTRTVARTVRVRLVDDLDGSEASETVTFGLDRRVYEVELSEENAGKLRAALAPFVSAARRSGTGGGRRRRSSGGSGSQPPHSNRARNASIREWAREHGHEVAVRGRIPASVLDAYRHDVG